MISLSMLCVHADVLERCCVCMQMSRDMCDVQTDVRDMCAYRCPETYVYHIDARICISIHRIYARIYMYIYYICSYIDR